jgi:heme oxygenase
MARETAEDETKPVDLRKIATFKYDELCYTAQRTLEQMPDKKVELDDQALALYEFLDLFLSNYEQAKKSQQKRDNERREAEAKEADRIIEEANTPANGGLLANAKISAEALQMLTEENEE